MSSINLDESQYAATRAPERRLRIVAGAGTGKTTTMIGRAERLLREHEADPARIVMITFTRKAASEIRQRLAATFGPAMAKRIRAGTFHSLGMRLLRRHWREAGYADDAFGIITKDEAHATIRQVALESEVWREFVDPETVGDQPPGQHPDVKTVLNACIEQVENWKQAGLTRAHIDDPARSARSWRMEAFARVYLAYMDELEINNVADYGDLILKPIELFERYPDIAGHEADRIDHVLVDEYQDTNPVQERLLEHLGQTARSLTVLGDPDQAIYSFRNASSEIMTRFPHDGEAVLDRNRRSTEQILGCANNLIGNNPRHHTKQLYSGLQGAKVTVSGHASHYQEGAFIAKKISSLLKDGVAPGSIAILMRSCSQRYTNALETSLMKQQIPYYMVSGTQLMERAEIRDLFGYLQLAVNPDNALAFRRVANKPRRHIGPAALAKIEECASGHKVPFHEACAIMADPERDGSLNKRARAGAQQLANLLYVLADMYQNDAEPAAIVDTAMDESGYRSMVARESEAQKINLEKMIKAIRQSSDLGYFLQEAALLMDNDDSESENRVRISTVHAAKGLEWEHVFCPALEEGVFPHQMALNFAHDGDINDPWVGPGTGGIEEERRLAYVAMTRARTTLHLSWAQRREGTKNAKPSRFFEEAGLATPEPYNPKRRGPDKKQSKGQGKQKRDTDQRAPASLEAGASTQRTMGSLFTL